MIRHGPVMGSNSGVCPRSIYKLSSSSLSALRMFAAAVIVGFETVIRKRVLSVVSVGQDAGQH